MLNVPTLLWLVPFRDPHPYQPVSTPCSFILVFTTLYQTPIILPIYSMNSTTIDQGLLLPSASSIVPKVPP